MQMDVDDDAAFLEDVINNVDLQGNRRNQVPEAGNILDPYAPANNDNQPLALNNVNNNYNLNPLADEFIPANANNNNLNPVNANNNPNLANANNNLNPVNANNNLNPANPNNNRNPVIANNNLNGNQNQPGFGAENGHLDRERNNQAAVRQGINRGQEMNGDQQREEQRRQRLYAIIEETENRAARARQAYYDLYGQIDNAGRNEEREFENGDRANERREREAVDNNRGYARQDGERRRQDGGYGRYQRTFRHGNRNDKREAGDENLNQTNRIGPQRQRRARFQGERDSAYWRGRFFQLREQSRKVKDFFFHDKF